MSNYNKATNFTAKDALSTGDPNKLVKGSDHDAEFDAIAVSSATKANKISGGTANNVVEQDSNGDLVDTGSATPAGDFVGTTDTQTLTNKTLTAPVVTLLKLKKGGDVASATALILGTEGNYFDVTGTTNITSITTVYPGIVIKLHFDDVLTFTHHSTDLILPSGASITTAAGDEAELVEYAAGDWRCTSYTLADGTVVGDLTEDNFPIPTTGANYRHAQAGGSFTTTSTSMVATGLVMVVQRAGEYQVSMYVESTGSNGGRGRVYKNAATSYSGMAAIGSEQVSTGGEKLQTFTFVAGDVLELYVAKDGGDTDATVSLFTLESAIKPFG